MEKSLVIYKGKSRYLPEQITFELKGKKLRLRHEYKEGAFCDDNGAVATIIDFFKKSVRIITYVVETNYWTVVECNYYKKRNGKIQATKIPIESMVRHVPERGQKEGPIRGEC